MEQAVSEEKQDIRQGFGQMTEDVGGAVQELEANPAEAVKDGAAAVVEAVESGEILPP